MIKILRSPEPAALPILRLQQLAKLRGRATPPTSADIDGYRVVSSELWRLQNYKCCYCERYIPEKFNDVEHYRPKASASREPGCSLKHGYWWLAFTWENLLFACPACNRSNKNDLFPLELGSMALQAEDAAPGAERPLLIDPSGGSNPVLHLEFYPFKVGKELQWWVRGRNGCAKGQKTVEVLGLNLTEYREVRTRYVEVYVEPAVNQLSAALNSGNSDRVNDAFDRALSLINPRSLYVALTSDVLRHFIPDKRLTAAGHKPWPVLESVGVD